MTAPNELIGGAGVPKLYLVLGDDACYTIVGRGGNALLFFS